MKNDPDGRAALQMTMETIEDHCPPGVLISEEAVNCIYGPTALWRGRSDFRRNCCNGREIAIAIDREAAGTEHQGIAP
ncbi:hypothetical protein NKI94_26030 [Mesorhizobium australicum]|uniref:hypothetical protein n=1 Tax=Mesorhizobium australicum TaxID=536018 RepID=UPI00333DE716